MAIDDRLLRDICEEARSLNPGDALRPEVLHAIAARARRRPIRFSVETGCGGSTLLLSNLSAEHVVFAIEGDNRIISRLRRSRFLRGETTWFIEGPTQRELPKYHFAKPVDLALLDGPHAFPFPQLEYYSIYPNLSPGALLIVDDIHIPSIHDLFRFLKADSMFRLDRLIGTTAFFERTAAAVFDPYGDGWWEQGYNRTPLRRYTWRQSLRSRVPASWRRGLRRRGADLRITIHAPAEGSTVRATATVSGESKIPAGSVLWVFVHRVDIGGWWPQGSVRLADSRPRWNLSCRFGEDVDEGHEFEIAAMEVDEDTDRRLRGWLEECREAGDYPPIALPTASTPVVRRVRRGPA